MKSPFEFTKYGESGLEFSELWPHVGEMADDICMIRSMTTDIPNHEPSLLMMNTGHIQPGRPVARVVAHVRARDREREPPRLRRALSGPADRRRDRRSGAIVVAATAIHQGTYISDRVPRRLEEDFDPATRSCPNIQLQTGLEGGGISDAEVDLVAAAQPSCTSNVVESNDASDRGRHLRHGDGVPDADRGTRSLRHPQGDRRPRRSCTAPGATARGASHGRPAGGAAAYAWSRSTTPRATRGTTTTTSSAPPQVNARRLRPGLRCRGEGPQVTRPLRRDARRVRHRVRAHARARDGWRRRRRPRHERPRPQPLRLFRSGSPAAGVKGGTDVRRARTTSASRPSRTQSTSTTCTPRSSTSWASTTSA